MAYISLLKQHRIRPSMTEVRKAWQNGVAERFVRTLREEELHLNDYDSFAEEYQQIGHYIETVYNRNRIHSALAYLTPAEFEINFLQHSAEINA